MVGSGAAAGTAGLVGRGVECDVVERAVAEARTGDARAVVVIGEGGVGKTRLVGEVATAARRAGLAVLTARSRITAPLTFGVVADALRSWLRGHEAPPLGAPFDRGLRQVLPEWPTTAGADSDLDDAQLQLLAGESVVRLVRAIASAQGALLVFDDLHAADPESVELVRHLVAAAIPATCVIVALRGGEVATADAFIDAMRRDGIATLLPLAPLDAGAVRVLVGALITGEPPDELVDDIVTRTDGVPLLVEEVVDAHVRAGSLVIGPDGAWWRGGRGAVPPTVRAMVAARLDRLDGVARDALTAAAVLGEFDAALVAEIADADDSAVVRAFAAGIDAGVVDRTGGVLSFRHAIVREAVIDDALPHVVAMQHHRAAAALEQRFGARADAAVLERRAAHLLHVGSRDSATTLLVAAVDDALAAHALLGAERLARGAVAAADSGAARVAADDALARVMAALGRFEEALAVDEATTADAGDALERQHRMALCALEAGRPEVASDVIARARAAGDDSAVALVIAGRVALVRGDGATAARCADEALAASSPTADIDGQLAARELQGRARDFLGDRVGAEAAWEQQAADAAAAGRTAAQLRALVQLGKVELFDGRPPARSREAVEVARAAGALVELGWAEENYAVALGIGGDVEGAGAVLRESIARCRSLHLDQLAYLLTHYAFMQSHVVDDVEDILAEAEAIAPTADLRLHTVGVRGDIALRRGDYAGALHWFDVGAEILRSLPGVVPSDSSCWLVLALAAVGRRAEAEHALRDAEQMPDLERWYGRPTLVAAARAILDRDAPAFDAAIAAAPERMQWDLALLRVVASDLIGGEWSARWLREALDWYEAHGATTVVDRVRRMLRGAGGVVPRRRRAAAASVPSALAARGVTVREAEVLGLLGDGLANAEIAARLFVSVRTVETHVSSLLTKLDVRGRGQLIALSSSLGATEPR
jgi:DNA-binding CsgD family transcriptional regulator